ncbi:type I iterative polyketide synthase [Aspergillus pseudoviridinutans]|uniref:Type I iterative polyketide synthase n=1 Tax=Aspergillus pseudoviridinutans TaxID=1517512 RepID=A0A9P3ET32_9EURO|nr:type I iterative polyketide synthase [Aspergillus pseudoviridinutans]GIJ84608.1 type I iterative polyketide synthase [Aspergillus pseudoviridinutans]
MGSLAKQDMVQNVLLFGPQALSLDVDDIKTLRDTLHSTPSNRWALDCLSELPDLWDVVAKNVPQLNSFDGKPLLKKFVDEFNTGSTSPSTFPLPNILSTPLVVIMHLTQYSKALRDTWPRLKDDDPLPADFMQESVAAGLCTGMLGAMVASHSNTLQSLATNSCKAVRQAMAIGAIVDAEMAADGSDGRAVSFSVSWGAGRTLDSVKKLIQPFSNTYISVIMDERRATITVSEKLAVAFAQTLKAAGLYIVRLELAGRFHWQGHEENAKQLAQLFASNEEFHLSSSRHMMFHSDMSSWSRDSLVEVTVLRGILLEKSDWFWSFSQLIDPSILDASQGRIIIIGPERCVPPTLASMLNSRITRIGDTSLAKIGISSQLSHGDEQIAVVGMSCHVPGAEDLEEFWNILVSGQSQHREVPPERFPMDMNWRQLQEQGAGGRKWFGNFIDDFDKFDHKFFKKSPRESASMDPQQRLCLKLAYQAMEQAGYFTSPSSTKDKHIGCYIGVGNVDYFDNIACHPANAYTATGNLRSFVAGKVSHWFGWTGPSLTVDTACSSSSVAIHQACRAILHGDCSSALAGGVNIFTSPNWFHNLAGASFLSPTGQCKPFDANADGYCRGEGGCAVYLKKLSSALTDGDQIFGVIAATKVYQNQNCTAITVPNSPSLSELFSDVVHQARLEPQNVSVVEAHGTGTPVGDPAEYDAVRTVFGGHRRGNTNLNLMSVKGLVGHAEFASGIISLVKILLMIHHGTIPPQPSFVTCSPGLKATSTDKIEITTRVKPWDANFRAALINNYGASGSNASMIVTESPTLRRIRSSVESASIEGQNYPFRLHALDQKSLKAYIHKLKKLLESQAATGTVDKSVLSASNLSFQLCRQSNSTLPWGAIFTASSLSDLGTKLSALENDSGSVVAEQYSPTTRPVVLCFGGQVSTFVGLDRAVFDSATVLREHLYKCDSACLSLGLGSIYPDIFLKTPIQDICRLQLALFAMQYSCARSWIDCGVNVAAVVGHSFGELTAQCIAGVYSLEDALRIVSRRARIIRDSWGSERGAMLAVEADSATVEDLIAKAIEASSGESDVGVACHNGPKSFTLAGSARWVEHFQSLAAEATPSPKMKRLNVTNAFHSKLVEPLMKELQDVAADVEFHTPTIRVERATRTSLSSDKLQSDFVAQHLRHPVYFHDAVQRLHKDFGDAIWLEAGSNSSIANMASRSLGSPASSHFQAINITSSNSLTFLVNNTIDLWKQGLNVAFWMHHVSQVQQYSPLILPPYQFEKATHWMELKEMPLSSPPPAATEQQSASQPEAPKTLTSFVAYQGENKQNARFRVNVGTSQFQVPANATKIAQKVAAVPAMFHVEIALHAIYSQDPELDGTEYQPLIRNTHLYDILCADVSDDLLIDVAWSGTPNRSCTWKIFSSADGSGAPNTVYSTGVISFTSPADPYVKENYDHLTRLSGRDRCERLLTGTDENVDVLQGRSIYRSMQQLIEYKEAVGKVTKVSSNGSEAAGRVKAHRLGGQEDGKVGYVNAIRTETFCQVASIFLNLMIEDEDSSSERDNKGAIFICRGFSQWLRSGSLSDNSIHPREWNVFVACHRGSESGYIADMFVFDGQDGSLAEVMLGVSYERLATDDIVTGQLAAEPSRAEIRSSSSTDGPAPADTPNNNPAKHISQKGLSSVSEGSEPAPTSAPSANAAVDAEVYDKTVELVCNLSGLEPDDIKKDSDLAELGIDSLMAMEVVREVDAAFHVVLTNDALMELTDFKSLVACIRSALGMSNDTAPANEPAASSTSKGIPGRHLNGTSAMEPTSTVNGDASSAMDGYNVIPNGSPATLSSSIVLEVFNELAWETDNLLEEHNLAGYNKHITPRTSELCVAYILDAFEQLGCSIRSAKAGDQLPRVSYLAKHEKLMKLMYQLLEVDARLIDIQGSTITRTAVAPPLKSADTLLAKLLEEEPTHMYDVKLAALVGTRFADLITGKEDGVQLIFGRQESREVASDFYAKSPFTGVWIHQLLLFMEKFISRIPKTGETINILEIGAGTGGTTSQLVPLLAKLGVPIRYTMSDISGSLVAAARKRFKQYPFVEFKVVDVESAPDAALVQSQHIVLATNCIHATRNLSVSLANIHRMLRTDGFLMLLEMTHQVPWIDFVFGLLEGWWLFEDERDYVLASVSHWEKTLRSVGFGHVDWTRGDHPEADLQRLIIAFPSKDSHPQAPRPSGYVSRVFTPSLPTNNAERQKISDNYVEKYSNDFELPESISSRSKATSKASSRCVLVTGATGSLGSHIVAAFAQRSDVKTVICINRLSNTEANVRQKSSFAMRGIELDAAAMAKLEVIETDTSKASIGLSADKYQSLLGRVTHIVHSAWPMSLTRPIRMYEIQMKILRNLISLAADIAKEQPQLRVGFLFVSSIAVVGNYPLWKGTPLVPEEPTTVESVPLTGYAEAKLVCETVLSKTLRRYPDRFQAKAVRVAQISGSTTNGYWNTSEYMPFLIKSSQSLGLLPYLEGTLSWYPVDGVAATLGDLLLSETADDWIYHIDNPSRQGWQEMIASLASALGLGKESIVPFDQWIDRVRRLRGSTVDNPALQLIDFFENYFIPMSCGELILDTTKANQYSETLRNQGPITDEVIGKYIKALRTSGFLN